METSRNNIQTYRQLLAGDIVDGIQVDVLNHAPDIVEYAVEHLASQHGGTEVYVLEQAAQGEDANAAPTLSEEVCLETGSANHFLTARETVHLDAEIFVEQLCVERSGSSGPSAARQFAVFIARKLKAAEGLALKEHVLRRVQKRGPHLILHFAEDTPLTPLVSVVCFQPSGLRCVARQCLAPRIVVVTPDKTRLSDDLLFDDNAENEPRTVVLESVERIPTLIHVVERYRDVKMTHSAWDGCNCRMEGRERRSSSYRGHTNADTGVSAQQQASSATVKRGCPEHSGYQVTSAVLTSESQPTTSVKNPKAFEAAICPPLKGVEDLPVPGLLHALARRFLRRDVRQAFQETEPRIAPSLQDAGNDDVHAACGRRVSKTSNEIQQGSTEEADPLFGGPNVSLHAPSTRLPRPEAEAAKQESAAAVKEAPAPAVDVNKERVLHQSGAEARQRPHPAKPLCLPEQKRKTTPTTRSLYCPTQREDSYAPTKLSIAASVNAAPEECQESAKSTLESCSTNSTYPDNARSSMKGSVLPLKLGKKLQPRDDQKSCHQGESSSIDTKASCLRKAPKTPQPPAKTRENYASKVLYIAEQARRRQQKMAVLVRDSNQGVIMEEFFSSHNHRAAFFPSGTLRDQNFAMKLDQFDVLITLPPVWRNLAVQNLREVGYLVNSSENIYAVYKEEIALKYAQLPPDVNEGIQRMDITFVFDDIKAMSNVKQAVVSEKRPVQVEKKRETLLSTETKETSPPHSELNAANEHLDNRPQELYEVKLTEYQHTTIEDIKQAVKSAIENANRLLKRKHIEARIPNFTSLRVSTAFAAGAKHWINQTKQNLSALEEERRSEIDEYIRLIEVLIECTIVLPLTGIRYVAEMLDLRIRTLQSQMKHCLPPSLQDIRSENTDDNCKAFTILLDVLQKHQAQDVFHGLIYTHSPACITALEEKMSCCDSLKLWLVVTKLFSSGGGYTMSSTKRDEHLKRFREGKKAVLITCGQYREVADEELLIDAVYFYGIPRGKLQNGPPLPDEVCTIAHDLM